MAVEYLGCSRVTVAYFCSRRGWWQAACYTVGPMILPFRAHGHDGHIQLTYETEGDPETIGSALVGAANFDPATFRGFPTMMVSVDYEGSGYRGTFGWIQVINCRDVDLPPFLADVDSPFCAFGHLPSFFDAPANPEHPDGPWVAETFLVASPDIARTRRLTPLVGFQWGYELTGGRAIAFLPSEIGPARWNAVRELLRTQFDSWTFLEWPR